MVLDYDKLMAWKFAEIEQSYDWRDTVIYALGIGLGDEPTNPEQLRFVYEKNLLALPTMASVLGNPGPWFKDSETGIDWSRSLHGEQQIIIHKTLPPKGRIIARNRVAELLDKGEKGAIIKVERTISDAEDGSLFSTMVKTDFCRGVGGFGGPPGTPPSPQPAPDRQPDFICDLPTVAQSALIYRLSGDANPLHADPEAATKAGFERPILHGLATFGMAGHAILRTCCGYDPQRITRLQVRFTTPFFPGETLRTEIWQDGQRLTFRALAIERQQVVLKNGSAEVSG